MIADLRQHFDRLQVIAYMRPVLSLVPSMLQQRIRMGLNRFDLPVPGYRRRFEPWITHAGADNVAFCRFDRADLAGGDVVEDFATRLGLDLSRVERQARNKSLSLEALAVLYCHNIFRGSLLWGPERLRARAQLYKQLAGFGTGKVGLAAELTDPLLTANRDDIAWMEQAAGFSVSGPASPVDEPIRSEEHLIAIGRRAMPDLRALLQEARKANPRPGPGGKRQPMRKQRAAGRKAPAQGAS